MRRVTSETIENLWGRCPSLRSISLAACPNVSDTSMNYLAENCEFLEQLFLWDCDIGDHSLFKLAETCGGLKIISLTQCTGITDDSLIPLIDRFPLLESLRIGNTSNLDDFSFRFEQEENGREGLLNDFEFDNVPNVSSSALNHILENAKALKALRLKDCRAVTDLGVLAILRSCKYLHHLSLEEL